MNPCYGLWDSREASERRLALLAGVSVVAVPSLSPHCPRSLSSLSSQMSLSSQWSLSSLALLAGVSVVKSESSGTVVDSDEPLP
jgi:hypothetical protein